MVGSRVFAVHLRRVIIRLTVMLVLCAGLLTVDILTGSGLSGGLAAETDSLSNVGDDNSSMASAGPKVTIDVRNADLMDVMSALAIKMGINIVMMDSKPQSVTFQAKDISCGKALDLITRNKGLSYMKEGNIIIVGSKDMLPKYEILTRFEIHFITAAKVKDLIGQLNIPEVTVLTVDTNPNAIWVQGNDESLKKVQDLIYAVDTEDNSEEGENLNYREIKTNNISPSRVLEVLNAAGLKVEHYVKLQDILVVFDQNILQRWDQVENLIKDFDFKGAESQTVYVHQLNNVVVGDAVQWLQEFDFGSEIRIITPNNYDRFGQQIVVVCPPSLVKQVRDALAQLDQPKKSVKLPVLTFKGEHGNAILEAKRSLLSELTGISLYKMHISKNMGTTDYPEYVLWVEEAPNKIKEIRDVLDEMKKTEETEDSSTEGTNN